MRLPSIRTTASQAITSCLSCARTPNGRATLSPDADTGHPQLRAGELAPQVVAAPEGTAGFRLDLAMLELGQRPHLSAPGSFSRYGRRRSSPAPRPRRRVVPQAHGRVDLRDLAPVDANLAPAPDPAGQAADPARARPPVARADQDSDDFGHFARATFDREVVDVATAPPVLVEQLVVEDV